MPHMIMTFIRCERIQKLNNSGMSGRALLAAFCFSVGPVLALAPAAHADSGPALAGGVKASSSPAGASDTDVKPKAEGTTRITLDAPSADGRKRTIRVYCNVTADAPHWSKLGKSVIYKTRARCYGNVPAVQLKVTGKLMRAGAPRATVAATAKETQTVRTGGGKATFYTPVPHGRKVKYSARFWGQSTAQIVSPIVGTKAQVVSQAADVKPR